MLERLATTEEYLSYHHILPEPAHFVLAHASLGVLLQLDDKINRDTISHFPLALYAARHWVKHAQFRNISSHIQEVMERLFDGAKPHFAAWVWLYDIDCHWIPLMSMIHPTHPEATPLYYASLCSFWGLVEHLICSYSPDVCSPCWPSEAPYPNIDQHFSCTLYLTNPDEGRGASDHHPHRSSLPTAPKMVYPPSERRSANGNTNLTLSRSKKQKNLPKSWSTNG